MQLLSPVVQGFFIVSSHLAAPFGTATTRPEAAATPFATRVIGSPKGSFWLFEPGKGYDLTNPPTPDGPGIKPQLRLDTTTWPVTIAPHKTAMVVVDMQNYFLSEALVDEEDNEGALGAEKALLSRCMPAARKAGIQIVHVTWGLTDDDLATLPPNVFRNFGNFERRAESTAPDLTIGDNMGNVTFPNGTEVSGGRLLMRNQWNTQLHQPIQDAFDESQQSSEDTVLLPDVRFDKDRHAGFRGESAPITRYLREKGITTLLFSGVNTDQCVLGSMEQANMLGFNTILLRDGSGTNSPIFATQMVEYESTWGLGFATNCEALSKSASSM